MLLAAAAPFAVAQNATDNREAGGKTDNTEKKEDKTKTGPLDPTKFTAEQVAESVIAFYGNSILGRQTLNQIRKTAFERGKIHFTDAKGTVETANYERWVLRGENLNKERVRLDQSFPASSYSLVYTGDKVFGVSDNIVFTPREDAVAALRNQLWHGLEGLLRYKENESKLELAGREKIMGVEYYLLDVIDKENRKTRFFVSLRSFRVMFLEYDYAGVKYQRRFYDYRYAQGTLVPYRSVLLADGKQIEETQIGTITFGQKVEEDLFRDSN